MDFSSSSGSSDEKSKIEVCSVSGHSTKDSNDNQLSPEGNSTVSKKQRKNSVSAGASLRIFKSIPEKAFVQTSSCNKTKNGSLYQCLSCWTDDFANCRFANLRVFCPGSSRGKYRTLGFVYGPNMDQDPAQDPIAIVSDIVMVERKRSTNEDEAQFLGTLRELHRSYSSILRDMMNLDLKLGQMQCWRNRTCGYRQTCDLCKSSILNRFVFCPVCALEVCPLCYFESPPHAHPWESFIVCEFPYDYSVIPEIPVAAAAMEEEKKNAGESERHKLAQNLIVNQVLPPALRLPGESHRDALLASSTDIDVFEVLWKCGMPVVCNNIDSKLVADWSPVGFMKKFGHDFKVPVIDSLTTAEAKMKISSFFGGMVSINDRIVDKKRNHKMILKVKDFPDAADFAEILPEYFQDFANSLPFQNYTARNGVANLAAYCPKECVPPDLGPKMYISYGGVRYNGIAICGYTNMHLDVSDAVNILVYIGCESDKDVISGFHSYLREKGVSENALIAQKTSFDERYSSRQNSEQPCSSVKVDRLLISGSSSDSNDIQMKEDSVQTKSENYYDFIRDAVLSYRCNEDFEGDKSSRKNAGRVKKRDFDYAENQSVQKDAYDDLSEEIGAVWHIFPACYLNVVSNFLAEIATRMDLDVDNAAHDQLIYLDDDLLLELETRYNVRPWVIHQKLGDGVFIPAGCLHQVYNVRSCIKVAEDFVSPQNLKRCYDLMLDRRALSEVHPHREDKLQIGLTLYSAARYLKELQNEKNSK